MSTGQAVTQPRLGLVGWARWAWRQLTSMKTALFLLLLLAIGAGLLALALRQWQTQTIPLALASLVAVFIGEIIGRGVFFALHMTIGIV